MITEAHTTEELRFLRRCAEACGDWAEAARITGALAERCRDDAGPALKEAAKRSKPTKQRPERERKGRRNSPRLTWGAVRAIRRSYAEGETKRSLARAFRTSETNIRAVVEGRTWKEPGG